LHEDSNNKINVQETVCILKQLGVQKVDISGGEPLLSDALQEIVHECVANGIYVTLTTSGFADNDNVEWLIENWRLFSRIIMSLDGFRELHNEHRGHDMAFSAFERLYERLTRQNCDILRINSVITTLLMQESNMSRFLRVISELKPTEWCIIQPHPINKKSDTFDLLCISRQEFDEFIERCSSRMDAAGIQLIYRTNDYFSEGWILDILGNIKKLSHTENYSISVNMLRTEITKIKRIIGGA